MITAEELRDAVLAAEDLVRSRWASLGHAGAHDGLAGVPGREYVVLNSGVGILIRFRFVFKSLDKFYHVLKTTHWNQALVFPTQHWW